MTDTMLPILRQLREARDDRAFAHLLLKMPDTILLKYQDVIVAMSRRRQFDAGVRFIEFRLTAMRAVRDGRGQLAAGLAAGLNQFQDAMAAFAEGGEA